MCRATLSQPLPLSPLANAAYTPHLVIRFQTLVQQARHVPGACLCDISPLAPVSVKDVEGVAALCAAHRTKGQRNFVLVFLFYFTEAYVLDTLQGARIGWGQLA